VEWNRFCGNQPFIEGTFLSFLKDSYFLVFLVHPLWQSILGCYFKHLPLEFLSWWSKYLLLHSLVYFFSFLWSYAVLSSRLAFALGLRKPPFLPPPPPLSGAATTSL
jgi:hypothetical protein